MTMSSRVEKRLFWTILIVAIVLRVAVFNAFSAKHADEAIQYIEQAHRIDFGYGIVPWEYRYVIRSWLIPLLLAGPMELGERIDPGGTLYLILPRVMVMLFNLAPVVAAWVIGRRQSLQHAIVAMAVAATWIECVLYAGQVLSETLATSAFMIGAAVMGAGVAGDRTRRLGTVAAGAMLALALLFRFQYAAAVLAFVAVAAGRDWRRWAMLAAGGLPVVIGGGLVDLAMHQMPYQWLLTNFRMNIGQGRMSGYGEASPFYYLYHLAVFWLPGIVAIPLLAVIGSRGNRALLAAAVANLLFHQLFGHKEYRFIWLSVLILVLLAALGSVEVLRRRRAEGKRSTTLLVAAWAGFSLLLAIAPAYRLKWRNSGAASRLASQVVRDPAVCGVAVPQLAWTMFGYGLLHRYTPIYVLPVTGAGSIAAPGALAQSFNVALSWGSGPPGYAKLECRDGKPARMCLFRRPGPCRSDAAAGPFLIQNWLERTDR
ncbi:MAG: hypothetical protein ABIR77_00765 [Sphingomicrobium sp.]